MQKYLILSDLDLTLINRQYEPTIPIDRIHAVVQRCIDRGTVLGLISDSSQVTLERWQTRFRFNGPIIAEKGAYIILPNGNKIITSDQRVDWPKLKRDMMEALRRGFEGDMQVIEDDYLRILQQGIAKRDNKRGVIIMNRSRQHSMSFHVRIFYGARGLAMNGLLFEKGVEIARQTLAKSGLHQLHFAPNPAYEIVIVSDPDVNKGIAMPVLLNHYPNRTLVVLGNDAGELPLRPYAQKLCAVQNATDDLKAVADYVARKPYTAGALEILEHIHKKKE